MAIGCTDEELDMLYFLYEPKSYPAPSLYDEFFKQLEEEERESTNPTNTKGLNKIVSPTDLE